MDNVQQTIARAGIRGDGSVLFSDDLDPAGYLDLVVDGARWKSMGQPDRITVTVTPARSTS